MASVMEYDPDRNARAEVMVAMRTTLHAANVTLALAKADRKLKDRAPIFNLSELHPHERRQLEDAALVALLLLNRDAVLFAETVAAQVVYEEFEHLGEEIWQGVGYEDDVEDDTWMQRVGKKVIRKFLGTLNGSVPGLTQHLAALERSRGGR